MLSLLSRPKQGVSPDDAAQADGASHNGSPAVAPPSPAPQSSASASGPTCAKCGAPMQPLQDWCLQCGAGQPGSLAAGAGWRTGGAILAIAALLVVGASVAAYAALSTHARKPRPVLALRPSTGAIPPTVTPTTPGAMPTTPGATPGATTPGATPGLPTTLKSTPPKIPLQTPTPKASGGGEPSANGLLFPPGSTKSTKAAAPSKKASKSSGATGQPAGEQGSGSSSGEGSGGESSGAGNGAEPPSPILLDTNAASTYNPYGYPATLFGDPSLAIDGESSTAWTARVDPAKAPHMAEGLVLDLKSAQKLASAKVKTTTTGMTVEMYGANGHALPPAITDPAWKRLGGAKVLMKKATTLKLKAHGVAYRFVLLWITKAPAGAAGVAVDELELFPA